MFFHSLLSSLWYFSFYHLLFFREVSDEKVIKTLKRLVHSISIYIFLSLFISSRVTLLLICNFELENDLDTSCNFSLVFVFLSISDTGDPRHSPIRLSRKRKKHS